MVVLQSTHDIRKVSLWLGHANLATTEVYYAQTVDMCSGGAKLPITSARALPDSA
jgi:integrase